MTDANAKDGKASDADAKQRENKKEQQQQRHQQLTTKKSGCLVFPDDDEAPFGYPDTDENAELHKNCAKCKGRAEDGGMCGYACAVYEGGRCIVCNNPLCGDCCDECATCEERFCIICWPKFHTGDRNDPDDPTEIKCTYVPIIPSSDDD